MRTCVMNHSLSVLPLRRLRKSGGALRGIISGRRVIFVAFKSVIRFNSQSAAEKLSNVKSVPLVVIGEVFVLRVLGNVEHQFPRFRTP